MVTFAQQNSEALVKPMPRARAQDRKCIPTASQRLNSPARTNLRRSAYEYRARLGSCSRDPIGYVDNNNIYCFLMDRPLIAVDPFGNATHTTTGKTKITFQLPGTLVCRCGTRNYKEFAIVASIQAAIELELGPIDFTIGGGIVTTDNFGMSCDLPECPTKCACHEHLDCTRVQKKKGFITVFLNWTRVVTDPKEFCFSPPMWGDEICITIWPGSDTTAYQVTDYEFEEQIVSDEGKCECVPNN